MVTHPLALRSAKFKLKSGINQEPSYGLPPVYSVLSLSSPPLRAEKRDCILLSTISLARSSLTKIKNQNGFGTYPHVF
jgi:hypothetical protein